MATDGRRALGKGSLIALAAVAACAPAPRYATTTNTAPAVVAVEEARQNQPVGTRMPQIDADMCRANELQWLVGKPRTQIPVPVDVVNRRVACTTCPVTEDYSPYRLNIFFNQRTGIVEQVRCG